MLSVLGFNHQVTPNGGTRIDQFRHYCLEEERVLRIPEGWGTDCRGYHASRSSTSEAISTLEITASRLI